MEIARYDLAMRFDPPARSFRGSVEIRFEGPAGPLVLNATELTVESVVVDGVPVSPEVDATAQELRIPVGSGGTHTATLAFAGQIAPNGLAGMYVSPFGPGAEILTTQMYPAGTRRFFPCVDRPAAKAEFRFRASVPKDAHVVFNTDPVEETADGDRKWVRFAPTPRMSSYLLYVGIGPFQETVRTDGALRTIVAAPAGRAEAATFALDHAAPFVRAYERYYDIPYPLPKLHLVAVPSFWAGAMENWGAIAFRETALLVDERTDAFSRRWNRLVLCHEIAHQWFGNLVTNAWWSDFWLNEAFATFVASRIVDRVHPGEASWSDFVQRETARGFSQDNLDAAHPIEVEISGPEEIGEIADGITYGKGASILRMIEAYLGEPAFRRGVTAYLNTHRYGAATGDDLWKALDQESGEPVSRIMRAWITRPGHPVVELRRENGGVTATQRRFRADGTPDPTTWPVPLVLEVDGVAHRTLLEGTAYRCPLPEGATLRVNPDRTGFYHVRLDAELFRATVDRWDRLSDLDQWGLLVDAAFFLTSGDASLADYLALIEKTRTTDRYLPAVTAARQLRSLQAFSTELPALAAADARFFRTQLERIGERRTSGEPETTGVLRNAVGWGLLGADPVRRRAFADAYAADPGAVDRDLLDVATAAYVWERGAEGWRQVREALRHPSSDEEAFRFATSLPFAPGAPELTATLELLEGPELSASRIWDVLRRANYVPSHGPALWEYYAARLPALDERWRGTPLLSMLLPESLPAIGLGRSEAVHRYFDGHRFREADRGVAEGLERLRLRELLGRRLTGRPTPRAA